MMAEVWYYVAYGFAWVVCNPWTTLLGMVSGWLFIVALQTLAKAVKIGSRC